MRPSGLLPEVLLTIFSRSVPSTTKTHSVLRCLDELECSISLRVFYRLCSNWAQSKAAIFGSRPVDEGCAQRTCSTCGAKHFICDRAECWNEADSRQCACTECGNQECNLGVGFSFYEPEDQRRDVRWISVGNRCRRIDHAERSCQVWRIDQPCWRGTASGNRRVA